MDLDSEDEEPQSDDQYELSFLSEALQHTQSLLHLTAPLGNQPLYTATETKNVSMHMDTYAP